MPNDWEIERSRKFLPNVWYGTYIFAICFDFNVFLQHLLNIKQIEKSQGPKCRMIGRSRNRAQPKERLKF